VNDTPEQTDPLITFVVPCYNVADYLDRSVMSILDGIPDLTAIEIILVDDGSNKDDTPARVDAFQEQYPGLIRAFHQANGGHGEAINTGLRAARGRYFKVLDADDWFDAEALQRVFVRLLVLVAGGDQPDLIITNYVYEKTDADGESSERAIRFPNVFPQARIFTWSEVGRFMLHQNLLMHTALYRTEILREVGLHLPAHTSYEDNVYVYLPLPAVQSLYYMDVDLYRYFIGRPDQTVHESTMVKHVDQQLLITRIMIDAFQLQTVEPRRLRDYMTQYLKMMMTVSTIFLRMSELPDKEEQRQAIWQYLKDSDPDTYYKLRGSALGISTNIPGSFGRWGAITGYHIIQRIFKFN